MELEIEFIEIKKLIARARLNSFKAVNKELISLYWNIGQFISKKVAHSDWGKSVVENLADYLKTAEPNSSGFSSQNLWRMKQFYEVYSGNEKLSPLVREITWSNNLLIISKTKTIVEYTLNKSVSPTLVLKYQTELFDKKLLELKLDEFFKIESNK